MIEFLWTHKQTKNTPEVISTKAWLKMWAKRVLKAPSLLILLFRRSIYSLRGAQLSESCLIERILIDGRITHLQIGDFSFIGQDVTIALHDSMTVGKCVVINSGSRILTASHDVSDPNWSTICRPIVIGDYAWIASNAIILPGVSIGKGSVVGAGAVVSKDVPPYSVVAGNPAKIVSNRSTNLQYCPISLSSPIQAWLGKNFKAQP